MLIQENLGLGLTVRDGTDRDFDRLAFWNRLTGQIEKVFVAIIGGGLTGCLVALDLAEHGYSCAIFEKKTNRLKRTSLANDGKMHLEYVYSADVSFRTTKTLIDDA